jgi:hypothetical protein
VSLLLFSLVPTLFTTAMIATEIPAAIRHQVIVFPSMSTLLAFEGADSKILHRMGRTTESHPARHPRRQLRTPPSRGRPVERGELVGTVALAVDDDADVALIVACAGFGAGGHATAGNAPSPSIASRIEVQEFPEALSGQRHHAASASASVRAGAVTASRAEACMYFGLRASRDAFLRKCSQPP